jgi:predicted RNase H-like HicB family nuclease
MDDRRLGTATDHAVRLHAMKSSYRATFLKRKAWWVAWSEDVPGALTQGKTLAEAKKNLRDAIRLMLEDVRTDRLPKTRIVHARVRV